MSAPYHPGSATAATPREAGASLPSWLTGALSRTAPPSVWLGRACVGAIVALVAVISVERLRLFALELNERDALALVPTLAAAAVELGPDGALSEHPALARLDDGEWLGDGRVLRRHGYLFAVASGPDACWSVVAWPWEPGRSGHAVFAACSEHGLLGHPDAAERLGSGVPAALACADADPGWRRVGR